MLLPTVSANETGLVSLSDLNFTELNVTEIEQADKLDLDNPTLSLKAIVQFQHDSNIKLSYFSSAIVQSYFHSFHSRAPPLLIIQHTLITYYSDFML